MMYFELLLGYITSAQQRDMSKQLGTSGLEGILVGTLSFLFQVGKLRHTLLTKSHNKELWPVWQHQSL